MKIDALRAEMEEDLSWRIDEIRFFQNTCASVGSEVGQQRFRKALVVLLYANLEGFAKLVFTTYVSAINAEAVACQEANLAIAAASLSDVFRYLRDGNGRVPDYKKLKLPDDAQLQKFARDREFLSQALELMQRPVAIPDKVTSTEANLGRDVLRKILYRLGLPHEDFEDIEPDLERLRNLRNNIAHGDAKQGISKEDYEKLRDSTFRIMRDLMLRVTHALLSKQFLLSTADTYEANRADFFM
ncbi:MAE_28990/MAE_18760 family HEPN-like nuclease [Paraburkholderia strydomiana]|uniref:MAE_28990/MAE_18760 family HEPN-like nuclease n=1 Tax=Paraburkholderia strydomiana TaxID=1245417 RepID=A0ABW9BUX7_9BURK